MFPASRVSAPEWRVPPGNGETQKGTSFAASVASQETQHSREITRKMVGERFYVLRLPRIHRATSVNTARFVLPSFQPPRLDATLCNRIANKQTNGPRESDLFVLQTFFLSLLSRFERHPHHARFSLLLYTHYLLYTLHLLYTHYYICCARLYECFIFLLFFLFKEEGRNWSTRLEPLLRSPFITANIAWHATCVRGTF